MRHSFIIKILLIQFTYFGKLLLSKFSLLHSNLLRFINKNNKFMSATMILYIRRCCYSPIIFITVCFYYMIINIQQGHDAFVPGDDAGVALTKKVSMTFPFNRSPYSRKQQSINCEPVSKVKELLCIHTSYMYM